MGLRQKGRKSGGERVPKKFKNCLRIIRRFKEAGRQIFRVSTGESSDSQRNPLQRGEHPGQGELLRAKKNKRIKRKQNPHCMPSIPPQNKGEAYGSGGGKRAHSSKRNVMFVKKDRSRPQRESTPMVVDPLGGDWVKDERKVLSLQ